MAEYEAAEGLYREALTIQQQRLGPEHPDVLPAAFGLVLALHTQGDVEGAEAVMGPLRPLLVGYVRDADLSDPQAWEGLEQLAVLYRYDGDFEAAAGLYRRLLAAVRERYGPTHPDVASTLYALGTMEARMDHHPAAEGYYREAIAVHRRLYGEADWRARATLADLAGVLEAQGRLDEAAALLRERLTLAVASHGAGSLEEAMAKRALADVLHQQGRSTEAEALYTDALAAVRRLDPAETTVAVALARLTLELGSLLVDRGEAARAEPLLRESLQRWEALLPGRNRLVADTQGALGRCLAAQGRSAEAEPLLRSSLAIAEEALGPDDEQTQRARERLDAFLRGDRLPAEEGVFGHHGR
jgi:tetratricopeptide (TPR) repeat protein